MLTIRSLETASRLYINQAVFTDLTSTVQALIRKSMITTSVAWLLLVISASSLVRGQFPAVCNTEDSLASKTCCPNNCGDHGDCVNVSDAVTQSWNRADPNIVEFLKNGPPGYGWPMDVRYQWPLRVFQKVCQCEEGWGGYDCSHCDFGYIEEGGECVKRSESQLYERKEFSKLSKEERDEYLAILKEAKNEAEDKMVWAVVTEEPMHNNTDDEPTFKLQNVSTYDMLVVLHFLSAREKDNEDCKSIFAKTLRITEVDFAHEFSSFTTWHRYYLLILESELRRIAERLGFSNFAIAYWDWKPNNEDIFNNRHFGEPFPGSITKGTQMDVTGQLFENGKWPVVCNEHYIEYIDYIKDDKTGNCTKVREVCNVQNNRAQNIRLQRGSHADKVRLLPGETSIQMGLAVDDNNEYDGFRKRLEGFVDLCAGNETKCTISNNSAHNNLHNAVHIYVGGHMRVLGPASNDPIFFLHHANIDRILESWFQYNKVNGNLPPFFVNDDSSDAVKHPGYSEDDYLTPFFPLKTNADMYKTADEFGYKYDELPPMPTQTYERCSDPTAVCLKDGYNPDSASALHQMASLPFLLVLAYTAHYVNFL